MKDEIKKKIDDTEKHLKEIINHIKDNRLDIKDNRLDIKYTIELADRMKELQSIITFLEKWYNEKL
jgi:hypothetical protein